MVCINGAGHGEASAGDCRQSATVALPKECLYYLLRARKIFIPVVVPSTIRMIETRVPTMKMSKQAILKRLDNLITQLFQKRITPE